MSQWIYLNGQYVPRHEARVSVFDRGFLYGDGVYETLRTYGPQVFMLDAHLTRLHRSANAIGITIPVHDHEWPSLIHELLCRNSLAQAGTASTPTSPDDAYIRITVTRGEGDIGLDTALARTPTVVVLAKVLAPYPPEWYLNGVTLCIASTRRNLATALPPQVKSLNFLNNILAKREASQGGAFDAVMLNAEGHLTECTVSNVFFVKAGKLYTPSIDCGILDGITRHLVLNLAQQAGISTEEGAYPAERLLTAEEVFLSNTTMEVMPVRAIGQTAIGTGSPGPMTVQLRAAFQAARSSS